MHTIQTQVTVNKDHILNLTLPEDITEGTYQVVIVMNPKLDNYNTNDQKQTITPQQEMNEIMKFAGCWEDLSEEEFKDFSEEIKQRRQNSRRFSDETLFT
ncbi:hypothetical protein [Geminocystis herdmanii]|uniref:hypothetical protein n=1 Tax=Geminocystis herdmanii TaxID=669359 RepID=UPI00034A7B63|nr:hypothetical protein [Geminocystis herdmanii]